MQCITPSTPVVSEEFPATDYLSVATEAHKRGFTTTPIKHGEKHPRLYKWNTHPAKTLSAALQHAHDFPNDDVGLVSRRGVGNVFWLDIDYQGVEDMIYRETGHRLPKTLTTSTRPVTAPWKKHFCFYQTASSVSKWTTEMTGIRDFSIVTGKDSAGKDIVPNLFDVKGVGKGGFVVAPGCCRASQTEHGIVHEKYTITDDSPIIPVPDWLVDWVIIRYKKYLRDNTARLNAEAEARRAFDSSMTAARVDLNVALFELDETKNVLSIDAKRGGRVPKEYRNGWLKSICGELAARGIPTDQLVRVMHILVELCEEYSGGEDELNRAISHLVNGMRIGNLWVSRKMVRDADEKTDDTGHDTGRKGLLSVLRHAAEGLPWKSGPITSYLVNENLRAVVKQAKIKCPTGNNWKLAVSRALRSIGAKSKRVIQNGRTVWVWERP